MGNGPLFDEVRRAVSQEASIPALRALLFMFAVFGAFAWLRRRPFLALLLLSAGGLLGLGYWLVQIDSPLGLGTDAAITRQWAQAGVNAFAEPKGQGFVWGTAPESALLPALASIGVPSPLILVVPQIAALLCLGFLILLPLTLVRNPTTAAFASSLAIGGGIWPGVSPYSSLLLHPSLFVIAAATGGVLFALARNRGARRIVHRYRVRVFAGLIAIGAVFGALKGSVEAGAGALLLAGASIALASPLRATLRRASQSHTSRRRLEALLLLCVFSGSGLFWWDPPRTLLGFVWARDGGGALGQPLLWMAQNVPVDGVILASPSYSAQIAALAGRRVLFHPPSEEGSAPSFPQPFRRARLFESTLRGQPIARLAEAFSVTHLFLGPGEATPPLFEETAEADEPRMSLILAYQDAEDFRIFRLTKK